MAVQQQQVCRFWHLYYCSGVLGYYHSLGIISLGEGRRFYTSYTQQFDRKGRHPYYENGTMSFFQLRPYEQMEFTRFPAPDDERFPPSGAFTLWHQPLLTCQIMWDNFIWSFREFQRVTLVGCLTLFCLIPLGILTRRLSLPESVYWTFGASLGVLGLHFLGPVREARLVGWFFPWLYLGLAGFTLWLWQLIQASTWESARKKSATLLIGGLFLFHILYPQYFKEVPKRWPLRLAPQVHILASEQILKTSGPGAVIASREPEVVYRSGGYWIGLPYGTPEEIVEWLYLGGADYLLLHDVVPIPEEEKIFWAEPEELHKHFPELEVVADFNLNEASAYGKNGRLLRFSATTRKTRPLSGTLSLGRDPSPGNRCLGARLPQSDRQPAVMRKKVRHLQEQPIPPSDQQPFWLPWGVLVLMLALLARLLWVNLFQGEIGGDAIRYLWISEHVRRGEWHLLPQLYSSPLLPVSIGLLAHLTGDPALAAKWMGVIMNTLAVGLAMAIMRQLLPTRPVLAWFTGAGLAVNHVWCRLAPFALTENLFYPLLMAFFWLLLRFRQQPTWWKGLALGTCWGALFLSREIGLYYGALGFLAWLA